MTIRRSIQDGRCEIYRTSPLKSTFLWFAFSVITRWKWILVALLALGKLRDTHTGKKAFSSKTCCLLQLALELLGSYYSNMPMQLKGIPPDSIHAVNPKEFRNERLWKFAYHFVKFNVIERSMIIHKVLLRLTAEQKKAWVGKLKQDQINCLNVTAKVVLTNVSVASLLPLT